MPESAVKPLKLVNTRDVAMAAPSTTGPEPGPEAAQAPSPPKRLARQLRFLRDDMRAMSIRTPLPDSWMLRELATLYWQRNPVLEELQECAHTRLLACLDMLRTLDDRANALPPSLQSGLNTFGIDHLRAFASAGSRHLSQML